MAVRQSTQKWVNAAAALSLSLLLLGMSPAATVRHTLVNIVGYALYLPEYPAMFLRSVGLSSANWFVGRDELQSKIETLSEEVETLRLENSELSAQKMRTVVNTLTENADVILRIPDTWWNDVRINKGRNSGLDVGSPVFQSGFLIGRVRALDDSFSWVELLTSSSLMLPVVVEETRDLGVVCGDDNGNVWLQYIPETRGVKEGMTVSTALIGDKFPPGLRIGKISSESVVSPSGFRSMKIAIGGNLSRLYAVSIKETR